MTKLIKARPTVYKGIQMRSRLEARFASLFDRWDLPWTYEPICFADGAHQYLPDFELHGIPIGLGDRSIADGVSSVPCYVEIKPDGDDWSTLQARMGTIWSSVPKAHLAILTPRFVSKAGGFGSFFPLGLAEYEVSGDLGHESYCIENWWDDGWFGRCKRCAKVSIYANWGGWMCHRCGFGDGDSGWDPVKDEQAWVKS